MRRLLIRTMSLLEVCRAPWISLAAHSPSLSGLYLDYPKAVSDGKWLVVANSCWQQLMAVTEMAVSAPSRSRAKAAQEKQSRPTTSYQVAISYILAFDDMWTWIATPAAEEHSRCRASSRYES